MSTTSQAATDAGSSPANDDDGPRLGAGPWLVALGTALWGTESAFRIPLTESGRFARDRGLYASDVLVLLEHVAILLTFLPWLVLRRADLPRRIGWRAAAYVIVSGIAGSAVGTIFFTEALRTGNPTVVNLLLNLQPIVSTVGGWLVFRERPGRRFARWAALAVGAGLLLSANPAETTGLPWFGISTVYTLVCALAWGTATVMGRGAMRELPLPLASTLRIVVGLACMVLIVAARGRLHLDQLAPDAANASSYAMLMALATVSGGIPLILYFRGLSRTPASLAGYFEMAQTLAAVAVTWGWFGHAMSARQVAAAIVLMFAVAMLQRAAPVEARAPAAA